MASSSDLTKCSLKRYDRLHLELSREFGFDNIVKNRMQVRVGEITPPLELTA